MAEPYLDQKEGPLPIWGWVAIVGGAGVAFLVVKRHRSSSQFGAGYGAAVAGSVNTPALGSLGSSALDSSGGMGGPVGPTNNLAWMNKATEDLILAGGNPLTIDTALRKYLYGQCLNSTEMNIISMSLRKLGSPPEGGVPIASLCPGQGGTGQLPPPPMVVRKPPSSVHPPTTVHPHPRPVGRRPPAPGHPAPGHHPAPHGRSYTVRPGDSLWNIAGNEYGNQALWPRIYIANHNLIGGNPNLIHPGQVLRIP